MGEGTCASTPDARGVKRHLHRTSPYRDRATLAPHASSKHLTPPHTFPGLVSGQPLRLRVECNARASSLAVLARLPPTASLDSRPCKVPSRTTTVRGTSFTNTRCSIPRCAAPPPRPYAPAPPPTPARSRRRRCTTRPSRITAAPPRPVPRPAPLTTSLRAISTPPTSRLLLLPSSARSIRFERSRALSCWVSASTLLLFSPTLTPSLITPSHRPDLRLCYKAHRHRSRLRPHHRSTLLESSHHPTLLKAQHRPDHPRSQYQQIPLLPLHSFADGNLT